MITRVVIAEGARKQLDKVAIHIEQKLYGWAEAVSRDGLDEVRKVAMAKRVKRNKDGSVNAIKYLEGKLGPLTFAMMIRAIREGEEISLEQFARKLGVSRSHLCDIEKGRKGISPERAARWAQLLGYSPTQFVRLAIQADLDAAGLKYKVDIEAA